MQAGVQFSTWQAKLCQLDLLELPQDAAKRRATPNPASIQRKVAQLQSSHPRIVSSVTVALKAFANSADTNGDMVFEYTPI